MPFQTNEIERKNHKILYKKNEYGNKVKVDGWRDYETALPFDDDPLCSDNINHFRSHYKHLGSDEWMTTTLDASKQIYTNSFINAINPEYSIVNCHTFIR